MSEQYKPLPDWSDAPKWARWRAVDQNGELCYYYNRPTLGSILWLPNRGKDVYAGKGYDPANWQTSLEARPEKIIPENLQT